MGRFLNVLASAVLLLLLHGLQAQKKGYEPGYVITLEGDTLMGLVRDRSAEPFVELYGRIRFRPEGKGGKRKYGPDDILGYAVGNRVYESIPVREETAFFRFRYYVDPDARRTFLRLIRREGPLTWYHQEFVHDDNFFLDYYPLFLLEGHPQLVRVTQGMLGLRRRQLLEYFKDCKTLVEAVENRQLTEVEDVYRFYLEHCSEASFPYPGGESLLGTWSIHLRPEPEAEPYFQNFQVVRINGNSLQGTFYGSSLQKARLNRNWDRLYFAFSTYDQNHQYYHSGYLEDGLLHGVTYCPDRDLVAPWTGVRN